MTTMMFCNIAWTRFYTGVEPQMPRFGATWDGSEDPRETAELWNFACYEDNYYGFVATAPHWRINLESLGGAKRDGFVDGVTVVWVARHPGLKKRVIVGWYENARVYPIYRPRPGGLPKEYITSASCDTCVLLSEVKRDYVVANPFRTIWFAREASNVIADVSDYIRGRKSN